MVEGCDDGFVALPDVRAPVDADGEGDDEVGPDPAAADVGASLPLMLWFVLPPGEVALRAADDPCVGDDPMAKTATRPPTKSSAAAADTGSHLLLCPPCCAAGCVAFTLRPFERPDTLRS